MRVINQYLFQNPIPEPNQSIPNPELDWGLIGKELIMFIVIDCEFNQAHYPDIINQCFESPLSYVIVKEIDNPLLELDSKSINQCHNCCLCMNKDFNPFCIESNKAVRLNETCINHERY